MEVILAIFLGILGSVFASFFGVIIDRVPLNQSIITPPSHCPSCNHKLAWYENIPIFSYLFLGGKCKECKSKIGIGSLIYEIIGACVGVLVALTFKISYEVIFIFLIALIYLLMAGYDYKTKTILDCMWIILAIIELSLFFFRIFYLHEEYLPYLISFGVGTILFILIKLIGILFIKKDILGTGDIIVFSLSCLSFNYFGIIIGLVVSCLPGSIIELIKQKKSKDNKEIAFLPYLLFGCFISLLFSNYLYEFFMELI